MKKAISLALLVISTLLLTPYIGMADSNSSDVPLLKVPVKIAPGTTYSLPFDVPGVYLGHLYDVYCSITSGEAPLTDPVIMSFGEKGGNSWSVTLNGRSIPSDAGAKLDRVENNYVGSINVWAPSTNNNVFLTFQNCDHDHTVILYNCIAKLRAASH